jgi:hypothetical protein
MRMPKSAADMIAHYQIDGSLVFRSRGDTWLNAFAEVYGPASGSIHTLAPEESIRLVWLRVGNAIRAAMGRMSG